MARSENFAFGKNFSEWGKGPKGDLKSAGERPREFDEDPFDDPALRHRIGDLIAKAMQKKNEKASRK